jgi:hypothetical protein
MSRVSLAALLCGVTVAVGSATGQTFRQTQTDDYTRYELGDPESQSFRIYYDVSATTAGAGYYFNSIRRGSEPTVHGVYDLMTGEELEWTIVDGTQAREDGMANAGANSQYIRVKLSRPVPEGGQARIRIDKTYKDPASYTTEGDVIAFSRSLGIKRNAVVLPRGFELIGCNYPCQVIEQDDGRIAVSFMNRGPSSVPLQVRARLLPRRSATAAAARTEGAEPVAAAMGSVPRVARARVDYRVTERAFEDRDIVYFLQQPETNSFRLYHDYTEKREGVSNYLNVVRAGSKASNPSAINLDTGEILEVETLRGAEIGERGIELGSAPSPETEVVVIWFDPVARGGSVRLRIEETYTDTNRYQAVGEELIWDRGFGRPRNTVILPEGWYLTANSIPAVVRETVVQETGEARISLRYMNDRPGNIQVFVKGKRR